MKQKTKTLIDPKDIEIKLSFTNYKLLKKEEFDLKGSCIYFVKGPNEIGKSTILQALRAVHEIKDETHKKVSLGEVEGVNEFTIPGPDNRMYNIVYEFTDATTKFVIFDEDGNKISKITDMRNVFRYNYIDASTFMNWSHSAEGRRKQKEHVLKLLPEDVLLKYTQIENEEQIAFNDRTKVGRDLDLQKKLVEEYTIDDVKLQIASNLEKAETLLKEKEVTLEKMIKPDPEAEKLNISIISISKDLENYKSEHNRITEEIEKLTKTLADLDLLIEDSNTKLNEAKNKHDKLAKSVNKAGESEEELRTSIAKGKEYVSLARVYKDTHTKYLSSKKLYDELVEKNESLTTEITTCRKNKEDIITKSDLPVDNISFDDEGYLNIDGLRFDENQTCESDAILLIAQIMCRINQTPIQILGDASLLDYAKLDKLYDIAESNGKIMFVDEVDRNIENLVIVGYEKKTTADKPSKVPKTDKTDKQNKKTELF
jgi:hypothetical protein